MERLAYLTSYGISNALKNNVVMALHEYHRESVSPNVVIDDRYLAVILQLLIVSVDTRHEILEKYFSKKSNHQQLWFSQDMTVPSHQSGMSKAASAPCRLQARR